MVNGLEEVVKLCRMTKDPRLLRAFEKIIVAMVPHADELLVSTCAVMLCIDMATMMMVVIYTMLSIYHHRYGCMGVWVYFVYKYMYINKYILL